MSPRTVEEYHDDGSTSALTAMLVVLLIAAIILALYFLWYVPSRQAAGLGNTDIRVTVPESRPDVDVNVPPPVSEPRGGAGPQETQPPEGQRTQPGTTPEPTSPNSGQ